MRRQSLHPLYATWKNMIRRCEPENAEEYIYHSGRGITVCPQWKTNFEQFIQDMGPRPIGTIIDRIDNDGHYTPDNCKWSTHKESQHNKRGLRYAVIDGVRYKAVDLAEISGLDPRVIYKRAEAGLSYAQVIDPKRWYIKVPFNPGAAISAAKRTGQTHCKHGHEYTPENTYIQVDGKYSWRCCRMCNRLKMQRRRGVASS